MTTNDNVAFIGTRNITPDEKAALQTLGELLARVNAKLHTSQMEGANLAVAGTYKKWGGKPVYHTTGLHKTAPWIVVYGDEMFIKTILASRGYSETGDTVCWDLLANLDSLNKFNNSITKALAAWEEEKLPA